MKNFPAAGILLSVIFIFSSCASANVYSPSGGHSIVDDFTGVGHAGLTNTEEEAEHLNYMGVRWTLQTFRWSGIEREQGNWNFQNYDTIVSSVTNANLKVLGVLGYDVSWIHTDGRDDYIPPERMPDFLNYVRRTVEHFKGRVDAWCIWNEPNFKRFWTGTIEEYTELVRQAAIAIREVDSEVIILAGAFNRNVTGLPKKMIEGLLESGAMENVDAVAFHPYEMSANRTNSLNEKFKRVLDQYGFGDKIWVTEVGYPTGGWYPTRVLERNYPTRIIKTCALLAANGVNRILWYEMFDPVERSKSSEDFFGLYRSASDYTSKGAEAFRLCAVYFSGSTCYTYLPAKGGISGTLKVFYFKKPDGGALVFWKEGSGNTNIDIDLPGINHLLHDIKTGNTNNIASKNTIRAGNEPVFITWQNNPDLLEERNPVVIGR